MGGLEFMPIPAAEQILDFGVFRTVQIVVDAAVASAVETVRAVALGLFRLFQ